MADKRYYLTEQRKRELERIIRKVDTINGPGVHNDSRSISINPPQIPGGKAGPPGETASFVVVKVTSFTSPSTLGGSGYWCRIQQRNATAITIKSSTYSLATYYEDADAVDCLFLNTVENNTATHSIVLNTYHLGMLLDETTSTGEPIIVGFGFSFAC